MKKEGLLAVLLLVIALFAAVPAFAGTIPASVVPENARWVAHLDMEKFASTSLYGYLDKSGTFEIKSRDISRWLKMDLPKDVTGVTVFGLDEAKEQAVVVVAGKFDKERLMTLLDLAEDHKEEPYGAYTVYSTDEDGFGAFLNDNLVVLSEQRSALERVLDTAAGKVKDFAKSALSASLKEIPSGAFLSGVVPNLTGLGPQVSESRLLEKASGIFFMAQETKDNLFVRVQLTADTAENAKNMADIAQGLIAMGRLSGGQGGQGGHMANVVGLLEGLQIKQEGKVLKLEFERPSKEIADFLSQGHGVKGLLD